MTAVEWLVEQCFPIMKNTPPLSQIIEQSKEMEKERIVKAWENGKKSTQCKAPICQMKTGLGYYNKTFKSE